MYYKIFIFICFYSLTAQAQAPGHMGKRFNVGYGFHTSPIVFQSNAQGQSLFGGGSLQNIGDENNTENLKFVLNVQHELFVEYTIKKRWVLGFSARFYKTTVGNYSHVKATSSYYDPYYGTYQIANINGYPTGLTHIKGENYSFYAKKFRKFYSAPWGRYTMFGLTVKRFTSSYNPNEMYLINYNNTRFSDFGVLKQKFVKFDVMLGYGRTRIFFDRMTVDYGLNVHALSLFSNLYVIRSLFEIGAKEYTNYNYIEKTSVQRLRNFNKVNVFCKVGFLLF